MKLLSGIFFDYIHFHNCFFTQIINGGEQMRTDKLWENIEQGVVLMDFSADWCAPCKAQEPIIKKITKTYLNRASIVEVNIDENKKLATKYMVQSIPTLILFKNGKEIKRFVGLQPEITITKSLDDAL
ncbi:thioredoxin [Desulfobacula toluolica]|nr:thioredoxin [Desulfobacula toluolica]